MNKLLRFRFYMLVIPAVIKKLLACSFLFILFVNVQYAYGQNGTCVNPCPYNLRTIGRIDTTVHEFDTLLLRDYYTVDENTVQYFGDTIGIKTGVIYKFRVEAGNSYGWHTDVSRSINDHIRTKLTLFYDDFETPITASNGAGSLWAQKLEWRANYTGVVGIMVTRGEQSIGPNGCGFNEDSIKMRFYCIDERGDRNLVWGRYSETLYVPCDQETYIYSSGLDGTIEGVSNIYSDNEDGYIVLYPEDETARLKIWGEFQFYIHTDSTTGQTYGLDTLFIYNGVYPTNHTLLAYYTTFGEIPADNPVITSTPNAPMSIRMKSNASCTINGVVFTVTCCIDPGMPPESSLLGEMMNDTTAVLSWDAATGSSIQYTWTLYDENDNFIAHDSTYNTSDTVAGLTCNTNYYFIITVASTCSNVGGTDTIRSALFNYPFNADILTPPNGGGCVGSEVIVTATVDAPIDPADIQWEWGGTGDTFRIGDVANQVIIDSVSQNTTLMVTATSPGGCVATDVVTIARFDLPSGFIVSSNSGRMDSEDSNTVIICEGDEATLTFMGDALNQYLLWSTGATGTSITIAPPGGTDTTLLLTVTDAFGCVSTFSFNVVVNRRPRMGTGDPYYYICTGDSATMTATGLSNYVWYRIDTLRTPDTMSVFSHYDTIWHGTGHTAFSLDTVFRDSTFIVVTTHHVQIAAGLNLDTLTVSPTRNTDYLLMGTDTNNCPGSMLYHVWIYSVPVVDSITAPPICLHENCHIGLYTQSGQDYRYEWFGEDHPDIILSRDTVLTVSPNATERYYVRVSNEHLIFNPHDPHLSAPWMVTVGCDTVCAVTVVVNPLPQISITASNDSVCANHPCTLFAQGNNVVFWSWDSLAFGNTYIVHPAATAAYRVTATDSNGCRKTDSVFVDVYPSPLHEEITSDSICLGESVQLATNNANDAYHWFPAYGLSSTSGANVTASPQSTTHYTLVSYSENNCTDTTSFTITVFEFPTPDIIPNTTICQGDTIPIFLSGGNFFEYGGIEYSIDDTLRFAPDTTTTYNFKVYNYSDCFSEASVTISVIPYFELLITASADTVCQNEHVSFRASGGVAYWWNNNVSADSITLSVDTTTIVSLRAQNNVTNCSVTVYDTVTVIPLPDYSIHQNQNSYCSHDTVLLTVEGFDYQYVWSDGGRGDSMLIFPTSGDYTYSVTAVNFFGCTKTENIDITVHAPATDFAINLSSDTVCFNENATVSVNIPAAELVESYLWNIPYAGSDNIFSYIPAISSTIPYNDTVNVTVVNHYGCITTSSATITINPVPTDTIISPNQICVLDTIRLNASGANSYHWGSPIPSEINREAAVFYFPYLPDPAKQIVLDVSNQYGCMISLNKTIVIDSLPDIFITSSQTGNGYCNNVLYDFTASGAETYGWSNGMSGNSVSFYPDASLITVTGTDGNGCVGTARSMVQIINSPEVSVNITDTTICALQPFVLTGHSSSSNAHYLWHTGNTDNTLYVDDLENSQAYILECYVTVNGVRCSQFDTATVTVNPLPVIVPTSNSPTCANNVGQIVLSGADAYRWNPDAALVINEDSSTVQVIASNSNEGALLQFTVTGINFATGCKNSITIPFSFIPPPAVNITSAAAGNALCEGDTTSLYAFGAESYRWYLAEESEPVSSSNDMVVSPVITTTYRLVGTISTGCSDTADFTLTVHQNPAASILATPSEVCKGSAATLSVSSTQQETSFMWVNNQNTDTLVGANVSVSPDQSVEYTVTALNESTSCAGDASVFIVVNALPTVFITAQDGICLGNSMNLTATGANSYEWFGEDTSMIGTFSVVNVMPLSLPFTSYTVIGTDLNGCKDTAAKAISVAALPELEISLNRPGYLCAGSGDFMGAVLTANHDDMTYLWTSDPPDDAMAFENNIAFLFPDTTTVYTIHAFFDNLGTICDAEFTQIVEVFPRPIVNLTAETPSVCHDVPIHVSATGAANYLWTSGSETLGTDSVLVILPTQTETYYVYGEDERGCIDFDSVTIEVANTSPRDSLLSYTALCYNTPTEIFLTGNNTYQWYPSAGLSDFTDSSVVITATEPIDYVVVYTNIFGCSDSLSVPITVKGIPNLMLPADTAICEGEELTIRIYGATSYLWEDGGTNDFFTLSPTEDTTFRVIGFIDNGCSAEAEMNVHVVSLFDLVVLSSVDTVCENVNSVMLTAYGAGDSYLWSTGDTVAVITVNPSQTTTYSVNAYNVTNRCYHAVSKTIVVIETPRFIISAADTAICINDTILLSTQHPEYGYLWSTGENGDAVSVSPQVSSSYSVEATNFFGCKGTANFYLTVHPLPDVKIIPDDTSTCAGNSIHLLAVGNGHSFLWNSGETTQEVTLVNETVSTYSVTAFSEYGCVSYDEQRISIYPNPVDEITFDDSTICPGDTVLLSTSGNNSCSWFPANTLSSTNTAEVNAFPLVTTEYRVVYTNRYGCSDSASATVEVYPAVNLQTTPDTIICDGETIRLVAANGITYLWSTGSTDNMITVSPEQNTAYSVTATNEYLCATSHTIHVFLVPSFELHITSSQDTICITDSVSLYYNGAADYIEWSTNATSSSITVYPSETTVYSLYGFNNTARCGKTAYDTVTVIPMPTCNVVPRTTVCENEWVTVSAISQYPFSFHWYALPTGSIQSDDNQPSINVTPAVTTVYFYDASNQYCTLTDSVTVEIAKQSDFQYNVISDACEKCTGEIFLNENTNYPPVSYLCNDTLIFNPLTSLCTGAYEITMIDSMGCSYEEIVVVDNLVPPSFVVARIISEVNGNDGRIILDSLVVNGDYVIQVYDESQTTLLYEGDYLTISNLASGNYWVQLTDKNCSFGLLVTIPVSCEFEVPVLIPNALCTDCPTANYWKPIIADYNDRDYGIEFWIYNRWGHQVFHGTDYEKGWDGSHSGSAKLFHDNAKVEQGVYTYVLLVKIKGSLAMKKIGSINVISTEN